MTYNYWLPLSLAAVVGSSLALACSSKFDSCEARRTCARAGTGGEDNGAAGQTGEGGSAGEVVGDIPHAGGTSTAGEDGSGGEGGEAGAEEPVQFGACSGLGRLACNGHATAQRLACDGSRWLAGTTCGTGELCDSTSGECAKTVPECLAAASGSVVCRGDKLLTCGLDSVTASEGETCAGVCKGGVCQKPICGDQKVEPGEACDEPAGATPGACVQCKTATTCGDGVVYMGHEQCDDGNKVSGDGCSATCRDEPVEIALGNHFTCARSGSGMVKCWGDNRWGQLGLNDKANRGDVPNTVPSQQSAINLGTGRKAISISARGDSACVLLDGGEVKCWGRNSQGQLGTGDTDHLGDGPGEMDTLNPIALGGGAKATVISAADTHTCVVLVGGSVKCWGAKDNGQLGQDSIIDALSPEQLPPIKLARPAISVSASNYIGLANLGPYGGTSCALLDNGTAQCWGIGRAAPYTSSADLNSNNSIGDFLGEMNALPSLTFSGGSSARSIVAGSVSAAILNDGSLRLWGSSIPLGLPELGRTQSVGISPADLALLPAVQMGGKKLKSIALARFHACAILEDDGTLKCWGSSPSGVLGLGSTSSTDPAAAPTDIASVYLGGRAARQIATSDEHTCAILDDGTLKCWGRNDYGQLGLGDTNNRGDTGDKLSADTTVSLSF
jgi:cysteine-rich repeat protein